MTYSDPTPVSSFRWTFWLLIVITAVLLVWDLYVAFSPEPGDTISEVLLWTAQRHPVLPFVVGVVCGHLFWPQRLPAEA